MNMPSCQCTARVVMARPFAGSRQRANDPILSRTAFAQERHPDWFERIATAWSGAGAFGVRRSSLLWHRFLVGPQLLVVYLLAFWLIPAEASSPLVIARKWERGLGVFSPLPPPYN